jgi:hypothetical protein
MGNSYGPLIRSLPLSLADRSYDPDRISPEQAAAAARAQKAGEGMRSSHDASTSKVNSPALKHEAIRMKDYGEVNPAVNGASGTDHGASFEGSRTSSPSPSAKPVDPSETHADIDFSHPAAIEPQQTVWLPRDEFGMSDDAARTIAAEGIDVTTDGAMMDGKGKVDISSAPPEETKRSVELARARSVDIADDEPENGGGGWGVKLAEKKAA